MQLVYANDNCIGCNKCIRACNCIGACIAGEENGIAKIDVDPVKCVACGACIDACEHDARKFNDDTDRFFRIWPEEKKYPCWLRRHIRQITRMNTGKCWAV